MWSGSKLLLNYINSEFNHLIIILTMTYLLPWTDFESKYNKIHGHLVPTICEQEMIKIWTRPTNEYCLN